MASLGGALTWPVAGHTQQKAVPAIGLQTSQLKHNPVLKGSSQIFVRDWRSKDLSRVKVIALKFGKPIFKMSASRSCFGSWWTKRSR
jgi:hypothetical protein